MARRRGTILLRASVQGAGPLASDFDRAQRDLQNELLAELRRVSVRGLDYLRAAAPHDSGDLIEQLEVISYPRAREPRVTFAAPTKPGHAGAEDGYPYVAVTRFGHRVDRIRAKPGSVLTVHGPGRTTIDRRERSVRAVRVAYDWVGVAERQIDREMIVTEQRLVRAIDTTILPGRIR